MHANANLEKERRVRTANMGIHGVNYKVWDTILGMIEALVRYVGVQDEVLDDVCEMVGGKVLSEQRGLREALEEVAPEAVWLEIKSWDMKGKRWEGKLPVLDGVVFLEPVF